MAVEILSLYRRESLSQRPRNARRGSLRTPRGWVSAELRVRVRVPLGVPTCEWWCESYPLGGLTLPTLLESSRVSPPHRP